MRLRLSTVRFQRAHEITIPKILYRSANIIDWYVILLLISQRSIQGHPIGLPPLMHRTVGYANHDFESCAMLMLGTARLRPWHL